MGDSVKNRHAQSSGAGHRCMSPLNSDRTAKYKEAESTNFAKRYKKIMSGSGEPSGLSSLPEEEGLTYDGHIRYHHGATVLTLPLTLDNVFAIGLILLLALLGCFYIWKLITRKTCSCELCSGQQVLGDLLETGSYGCPDADGDGVTHASSASVTPSPSASGQPFIEARPATVGQASCGSATPSPSVSGQPANSARPGVLGQVSSLS